MATITKNGKAFDSGDVHIAMFGSLSYEVLDISYDTEQEHQPNHSIGSNEMTSWSKGKISHKASLTLRLASASSVEKAVGGNLLNAKPFDINITFVNDDNDIINDTVTAKFQKQGRSVGSEMDLKYQYDLFAISISYNNL